MEQRRRCGRWVAGVGEWRRRIRRVGLLGSEGRYELEFAGKLGFRKEEGSIKAAIVMEFGERENKMVFDCLSIKHQVMK